MPKNKSAKRKRNTVPTPPQKLPKTTTATITPPRDVSPLEPKTLQTVISDDELDITIETLTTLSQFPSLLKSKACKDLRAAVFDFRKACTTGANAAEGANLTARITAALADEKYTDAKILLSEMKIRREEPKLGALCRWVRDLDVVSGLSTPKDVRHSAKDEELLSVLDLVLRVSGPIDSNPHTAFTTDPIALQTVWDLSPTSEALPVYASVLDGTIFDGTPTDLKTSIRAIETTAGAMRNPPNHHPAIVYTTTPNAVPLSPTYPTIIHHSHPHVPGLALAKNVLSPKECKAIIAAGEAVNFLPDAPLREDGDISILAHNFYWVVDTAFHDILWARISPFVPASIGGRLARGLNRRFRVYRYVPGAEYRCHIDGAWPPSGVRPDNTYVYDDSPPDNKQSSLITFLVYLNDEFEGGETTFFLPGAREGTMNAYPVRPVMGSVAMFPHGEARGALLHEGTGVKKGAKYVIRTDVEYDVKPCE